MARTILIWAPTGLATPTCKLMLRSAPTTLVETITLAEHATVKRAYTGTVTAAAGSYRYNLLSAGVFIGGGSVYVGATDGLTYEEDNSLDWGNVTNPTATVNLSGTTVKDATDVETALATIAGYIDTEVAAIKAKTDNLPEDPADASDVAAAFAALGTGTGARTVTITVENSLTDPVQNAKVRVTLGATTYVQTTGPSGIVVFNLDDGDWTVSITAVGYSFAGIGLTVNGTEAQTYALTTNSVSAPAAPNLSTGVLLCLGTDGLPEPGVVVTFRMTAGPGSAGYALDSAEFSATSDVDGLIESEFLKSATYKARRGPENAIGTRETSFTVSPFTESFNLPQILGNP